jgi:hypothetical protein
VSSDRSLSVGIVGGSIAGCMMALELLGAGHRLTMFERSHGQLEGSLGAGLGTPTPMFRTLVDRGLIDATLPHLFLDEMVFVSRTANGERFGHVALTIPLIFAAFHWGDLYRGLRSRVPDASYRGRRALFPDSGPEYRGYVCWRGVLDEREMDAGELMPATFARFGSTGLPGSFLYPVPGADGSVATGDRLINWGCYVPVSAAELPGFLVDANGHQHEGAIPPGHLPADREQRLRAIARESLPPYYAGASSTRRSSGTLPTSPPWTRPAAGEWWRRSVTHPEGFTFEAPRSES